MKLPRNPALMHVQHPFFLMLQAVLIVACLFATAPVKAEDFLDPEVAFTAVAKMVEPGIAEVTLTVADGYYLYRERLKFTSDDAQLGEPLLPKGKVKFDETFQKEVETYRHSVVVRIPVKADHAFNLKVVRQGCADQGLCYPPLESAFTLPITIAASATDKVDPGTQSAATVPVTVSGTTESETSTISAALKSGKLLVILPLFFVLGLGLSLTPCVLPMVPILSFIIVGEGVGVSRLRAFLLSVAYVLLMVIFALSMFNVYQLQMPAALQTKLTEVSEGQRNSKLGKLFGVFLMGAISALIVGPCVTGPLLGALVYISQTRDILVGGAAMFAIAIGMGVPLLLLGLSAGSLLPRAGVWMENIKHFFGVLMLA